MGIIFLEQSVIYIMHFYEGNDIFYFSNLRVLTRRIQSVSFISVIGEYFLFLLIGYNCRMKINRVIDKNVLVSDLLSRRILVRR